MKTKELEQLINELEKKVKKLEGVKYPTLAPVYVPVSPAPVFPGYPAWPHPYYPYPNYYVTTTTSEGTSGGGSICYQHGGMVSGQGGFKCV